MIEVSWKLDAGYKGVFGYIEWPYAKLVFSGKEIQVRMEKLPAIPSAVKIMVTNPDAAEIIEMLMIADAVRRHLLDAFVENPEIHLVMPYLPYARQDRACAPGEAFSLHVLATMLNAAHFTSIEVWDVHSDVARREIHHLINVTADRLIPNKPFLDTNTIIVAPDKGAVERAKLVAQMMVRPLIRAEKTRDPNDGKITRTHVPYVIGEASQAVVVDELSGNKLVAAEANFLIVDDICDGGATFIELAKALRPLTKGKIKLWVTHGIFFKGFEVFEGLIDEIYTANCFRTDVPSFVHVGHCRIED